MTEDNINFTSTNFPWPQKGDNLFAPGKDWWNNASLNYALDDWEQYIVGYLKAAKLLVNYIDANKINQDILVYPIVFLYRHYLELRIKKLILGCKILLDEDPKFKKYHKLKELWKDCKALIKRVEPQSEARDLEAIDEIIIQFSKVDPGSYSFRYPITKQDEKSLPEDLKYINLRNFSEIMERVSNFFEAGEMMVSVYLDNKQDLK